MTIALKSRVGKIEQRSPAVAAFPAPSAGVIFGGRRDPGAIIHALGLAHMAEMTVQVLDEGSPDDPPRLVGPLSERGAFGQCREHANLVTRASRMAHRGGSWFFTWSRGGEGWIMDWASPTGDPVSLYECTT